MTFNRRLFYIGGFDPRGVRFYQQLSQDQLARHADLTRDTITMSKRSNVSRERADWTVRNDSADVTTLYTFLRWEDVVQRAWIRNPFALAARVVATYRDHARHLDFALARRLGSGPLITLLYPPIVAVLLPLLIALPLFALGLLVLPWWAALGAALPIGIVLATPMLTALHAPWLLRFFVFNGDLARRGCDAALEARLTHFVDAILAELDGPYDEVLLVTHSNGAILAMPVMARLLAARGGALPANFTLVTLGQCIPLVSCRRDARWFNATLATLATHDFRWIDIGSPPDGAAYFGVNPLLIHNVASRPRVELLSPRFHKFYEPARYHKGWRDKYEIHFDYLRTGDRVSPLDLPSIVASARPIETAVAAFRTIA